VDCPGGVEMIPSITSLVLGVVSALLAIGMSSDTRCMDKICAAVGFIGFLVVVFTGVLAVLVGRAVIMDRRRVRSWAIAGIVLGVSAIIRASWVLFFFLRINHLL
jgi:hypothetical protein